jgi:uncharacterized RDD family membrane protein YckC
MSYVGSPGGAQAYSGKGSGPRAGFWKRFAGALLDGIILGLANGILEVALKGVGYALGIILSLTYATVLIGGSRGQTLGQQAVGIRVISFETGGSIGYGRAFIRVISAYLSAVVIVLGYLWMLWDGEKQCWHDKLAGDVVVPVSAYPLP